MGGLHLEDDREVLSGRAVQKRRLALLTLLATAPARTASRDKVVALLWPDKDDEQARHLLSVSLYEIRKELGEDVIESRGDELVLDPTTVGTDLEAFDDALDRGDPGAAVEAYSGPFLDGFHLGGSAPFDHWVDGEREAVEQRYRRALEALAEEREAAGDATGAVDAWRKLAAADRYNTRVAVRLLGALEAAGNRAGALQFARVHRSLLDQEFGTAPSADFEAAVARLRAPEEPVEPGAVEPVEPGAVVTAADPAENPSPAAIPGVTKSDPAPPPLPVKPSVQAVAPRGVEDGRVSVSRTTLAALIVLALVGAYLIFGGPSHPVSLAVIPFQAVGIDDEDYRQALEHGITVEILDALARIEGVRVPVQTATLALRDVDAAGAAQRLGVAYVIGGTIRASPDSLRINVDLSDDRGFSLWTHQFQRPRHDAFRISEDIAAAVLREVAPRLDFREPPRTAALPDPDAERFFNLGRAAWEQRTRFGDALAYFEEAVALDPEHAEAHAAIADAYNLLGAYDYGLMDPAAARPLARQAAERALQLDPELAEAHAALAMTQFAFEKDWEAAEASFRSALRLDGRDTETLHWYGLFLTTRGRLDEAMAAVDSALALDSLSVITRTSRARQYFFRRMYAEARREYERALERDPTFVTALLGLGLTRVQQGAPEAALESYRRAADAVGRVLPLNRALMGHAHAVAGREDSARAVLDGLRKARAAGAYVPPEYEGLIHVALGEFDAAVDAFRAAYERTSGAAAYYEVEPLLEPIQGYPPFEELTDAIGLPEVFPAYTAGGPETGPPGA